MTQIHKTNLIYTRRSPALRGPAPPDHQHLAVGYLKKLQQLPAAGLLNKGVKTPLEPPTDIFKRNNSNNRSIHKIKIREEEIVILTSWPGASMW